MESAGVLPALGFGLAQHAVPLSPVEIAHLRALRPAYLWRELNLARPDWEETLTGRGMTRLCCKRSWNFQSCVMPRVKN